MLIDESFGRGASSESPPGGMTRPEQTKSGGTCQEKLDGGKECYFGSSVTTPASTSTSGAFQLIAVSLLA